jgi:N6-adenosine-specific RNA methylase IME4
MPVGGSIAPNHAEYLLVARRGVPKLLERLPSSVIHAPKGDHSAKPEVFLDLIEQASPPPRLELFARRQRLGWDTWGDEALEHVAL